VAWCGRWVSPSPGYVLGSQIPGIDTYLLPIIAVVVVVSLIPLALEVLRCDATHRCIPSRADLVPMFADHRPGFPPPRPKAEPNP